MQTCRELEKLFSKNTRILYVIVEDDAHSEAQERLGRNLTDDELELCQKSLENGSMWSECIGYALDDIEDAEEKTHAKK